MCRSHFGSLLEGIAPYVAVYRCVCWRKRDQDPPMSPSCSTSLYLAYGFFERISQRESTLLITVPWKFGHNLHTGVLWYSMTSLEILSSRRRYYWAGSSLEIYHFSLWSLEMWLLHYSETGRLKICYRKKAGGRGATGEKERKPRKRTVDVVMKDKRISGKNAWSTMSNTAGSKHNYWKVSNADCDDSNKTNVNCLMEQSQNAMGWANYRKWT